MNVSAGLTGAGFVTLSGTVLIGFEEADPIMLLVSAGLLAVVPAIVLGRVSFGSELTRDEKRRWLRALTGRRAMQAWSVYLTSTDRRAALSRLRSARVGSASEPPTAPSARLGTGPGNEA